MESKKSSSQQQATINGQQARYTTMKIHSYILSTVLALTSLGYADDAESNRRNGTQRPSAEKGRSASNNSKLSNSTRIAYLPDLSYVKDGVGHERQSLSMLLPSTKTDSPLPVIVFIHGGAWKAGHKDTGIKRLEPYVNSGKFAGVTVGYRLSQQAIWPAQIHDCKAAIRWVRANAKQYNLDPNRIAVWGTSAGGHLANMLGVGGDVESLEGAIGPHTNQNSRVTCVVNYFGPTRLLTMDDFDSTMVHNAPNSPESLLIGGPIQQNKDKANAASPMSYVTADDAPFLHVHGTKDPLVPYNQAEVFHRELTRVGVSSELHPVVGAGHGFRDANADARLRAFFELHLLSPNDK